MKSCLLLLCLLCINSYAQIDFKSPILSSPNASSFLKYGEIPVGNYTGVPNISVPIFQLIEGGITFPLSLNYHASGIKVEEVASSAGLGWSLSAGGLISSEIRGLSDCSSFGFQGNDVKLFMERTMINYNLLKGLSGRNISNYYGMYFKDSWAADLLDPSICNGNDKVFLEEVKENQMDGEADLYYINLPGLSCKFFKNNDGDFMTIPLSNIIIHWDYGGFYWLITDSKGIKYKFSQSEYSHPDSSPMGQTNTWWIEEIEDVDGNKVSFHYTPYLSHTYSFNQSQYAFIEGSGDFHKPNIPVGITSEHSLLILRKLDSISTTSGNSVYFYSSKSRLDQEYEYSLDSIKIRNFIGNYTLRCRLDHSYFIGTPSQSYPFEDETFPNSSSSKRFKLDGIKINNECYQFKYDETTLPSRYSIDQDLWGYYNAAGNNIFVPYFFAQGPNGTSLTFDGGNRTVNPAVNQAGILKSITYPTGGSTTFDYESNEINDYLRNGVPAMITLHDEQIDVIAAAPNCVNGYIYTEPFDYKLGSTPINFKFTNILNDPPNWDEYAYIYMVDAATSGTVLQRELLTPANGFATSPLYFQLPPGTYKIRLCTGLNTMYIRCELNWKSPDYDLTNLNLKVDKKIGGLRIKTITNKSDGADPPMVRNYKYIDPITNIGSGAIVNYPMNFRDYFTATVSNTPSGIGGGCFVEIRGNAHYLMYTSSSTTPIALNSESIVGYSSVIEEIGGNDVRGRIIYNFSNVISDPDIKIDPDFDFPATPNTSYSFARGLLVSKVLYKYEHGNFVLEDSLINYYTKYSNWYQNLKRCVNLRAVQHDEIIDQSLPPCPPVLISGNTNWRPYVMVSGWNNLDSTIRKIYSGLNFTKEITRFKYTDCNSVPVLLLTQKISDCSNGDMLQEKYSYPSDYPDLQTGNDYGIKNLQDKHIIDAIIENSRYIKKSGETSFKLTGSSFNSYYSNNGRPKTLNQIENTELLSNFAPAYSSGGNVIIDTKYKPKLNFDSYDTKGNLLQVHSDCRIPISYKYGYNFTYPIAETKNATTTECGHTGFENNESNSFPIPGYAKTDFVTDPFTGKKSLKVTSEYGPGTSFEVGDNAQNHCGYKASCWVKGSTDAYLHIEVDGVWGTNNRATNPANDGLWHLLEVELPRIKIEPYFDPNLKIKVYTGGNGTFDDLRFYPMDAQMTTYTYEPLIGITSASDANNKPTYYNYDPFNRLSYVKDHQGNILKKYDYHYKTP